MTSLERLCGRGPVLVVAPHPDDESLGCGGLIACASAAGLDVSVAVLTDGAASHPNSRLWPAARLAQLRRDELEAAVGVLTQAHGRVLAFAAPDGRLEAVEGEAQAWLAQAVAPPPAVVFTTWAADPHPDHQAAARIAARQAGLWGAALYAYPVWGLILADDAAAAGCAACLRLDISAQLDRKRAAILAHRSQTSDMIHDDPRGFRLRPEDLERHLAPFESFLHLR